MALIRFKCDGGDHGNGDGGGDNDDDGGCR